MTVNLIKNKLTFLFYNHSPNAFLKMLAVVTIWIYGSSKINRRTASKKRTGGNFAKN